MTLAKIGNYVDVLLGFSIDASGYKKLRATGTDAMIASSMKNDPSGPSKKKRVTGIEPATFSLGS
jgi:hypothetical protein